MYYPSIQPSIYFSTHLSPEQEFMSVISIHPSIHQSILHSTIILSINLSIQVSPIHPAISPTSTYSSFSKVFFFYPSVHPSNNVMFPIYSGVSYLGTVSVYHVCCGKNGQSNQEKPPLALPFTPYSYFRAASWTVDMCRGSTLPVLTYNTIRS